MSLFRFFCSVFFFTKWRLSWSVWWSRFLWGRHWRLQLRQNRVSYFYVYMILIGSRVARNYSGAPGQNVTDFQELYTFSHKEVPFGGLRDELSHFVEHATLELNYHDDWHATCKAMTICVYPRLLVAAVLDFWNLKVSQIGRPRKPHRRTKRHILNLWSIRWVNRYVRARPVGLNKLIFAVLDRWLSVFLNFLFFLSQFVLFCFYFSVCYVTFSSVSDHWSFCF